MIAGLVDVSMCAACRLEAGTMHCALLPQKTRTKASWLGEEDTVLVGPEISEDFTFKTINFLIERGIHSSFFSDSGPYVTQMNIFI